MVATVAGVDWQGWLARWDAQQMGYLEQREERFAIMLDALEVHLPETFVAVDLACGPGSISQRLLARFPRARCVAVDMDPVLLALGQGALGTVAGRLRWVDADLTAETWLDSLGESAVDAVLSTTALHWLAGDRLARLYRQLGRVVRPGGLFLNGDHMAYPPHLATFRAIADTLRRRRWEAPFGSYGAENWEEWWQALRAEAPLAELFAERERRFATRSREWINASYAFQKGALLEAGFREVDVLWQRLDNRVLLAVR